MGPVSRVQIDAIASEILQTQKFSNNPASMLVMSLYDSVGSTEQHAVNGCHDLHRVREVRPRGGHHFPEVKSRLPTFQSCTFLHLLHG